MGARSSRNTTQNNRSDGHLLEYFRNTFIRGGGAALPVPRISATGGNVSALEPGNGYKYHTFTSPGTFTVTIGGNVEVLIVGGGAGGAILGGGGGAGGLVHAPSYPVLVPFTITIGGGGSGSPSFSVHSGQGTPTTFIGSETITALGGGRANDQGIGHPGGSGGGADGPNPVGSATQPTANPGIAGLLQYGNPGGTGSGDSPGDAAGGGGGAGGVGGGPSPRNGGIGLQYPEFTGPLIGVSPLAPLSGYFAGGGGGGDRPETASNTTGGLGGGGNGGGSPTAGQTNSGGGGGGGRYPTPAGSSGGSGIVIIRYLV